MWKNAKNESYYIKNKKYKNNYKVITTLLSGCMNLLDMLIKRNIKTKKLALQN